MIVSEQIRKMIVSMPLYTIEIGVFSEDANRKKSKAKISVGITNAELMFIQEKGSPLHHLPARPVLEMTLRYGNTLIKNTLQKALSVYLKDGEVGMEKELNKLCLRLENYARDIIYSNDGRLAPNAPSVSRRKGENHPLFDTGQLARSITCRLIRN